MHGRNLVESFDSRKEISSLSSSETRDYIAILGVNAISAEDGSVFFLQHMSNISKDLSQAKKIVFIVSLEKVVKTRQDALFHTRSMGIFGLESVLLDLMPKDIEKFDFDALPLLTWNEEREAHVVILDNGRSELLRNGYKIYFSASTAGHVPVNVLSDNMLSMREEWSTVKITSSATSRDGCLPLRCASTAGAVKLNVLWILRYQLCSGNRRLNIMLITKELEKAHA